MIRRVQTTLELYNCEREPVRIPIWEDRSDPASILEDSLIPECTLEFWEDTPIADLLPYAVVEIHDACWTLFMIGRVSA